MKDDDTAPWLDTNGEMLSTEILREVSRHWSPETWGRYGDALEAPQTEFMTRHYQTILDTFATKQVESSNEVEEERDYSALRIAFAALPTVDQAILEAVFIDGNSEEQTARKFGITRREVISSKRRSVSALQQSLGGCVADCASPLFQSSKQIGLENRSVKKIRMSDRGQYRHF